MLISEQEKEEIKKKYEDNISKEVLTHLKRNYPIYEFNMKFTDSPVKQILVDDKLYMLSQNKKYLVNKNLRFPLISQIRDRIIIILKFMSLIFIIIFYLSNGT